LKLETRNSTRQLLLLKTPDGAQSQMAAQELSKPRLS